MFNLPLIINPQARRGSARQQLRQLDAIFSEYGIQLEVHIASELHSIERDIAALARDDRVLVAGGDGSVNQAVHGLCSANSSAALGVVPLGTGNDFAKAGGFGIDWRIAAKRLAQCLQRGNMTRMVDVGLCNGRFFANGVGVGLDARVAASSESIRLPIGQLVYLVGIARCVIEGLSSPDMTIAIDGEQVWNGPVTLASVANGSSVGGQFLIAPEAKIDDQLFNIVVAEAVSRRRIGGLVRKLMHGSHVGEPEVHVFSGQSVTITSSAPVPSHLDGEVQASTDHFEIKLLPKRLRLLAV